MASHKYIDKKWNYIYDTGKSVGSGIKKEARRQVSNIYSTGKSVGNGIKKEVGRQASNIYSTVKKDAPVVANSVYKNTAGGLKKAHSSTPVQTSLDKGKKAISTIEKKGKQITTNHITKGEEYVRKAKNKLKNKPTGQPAKKAVNDAVKSVENKTKSAINSAKRSTKKTTNAVKSTAKDVKKASWHYLKSGVEKEQAKYLKLSKPSMYKATEALAKKRGFTKEETDYVKKAAGKTYDEYTKTWEDASRNDRKIAANTKTGKSNF